MNGNGLSRTITVHSADGVSESPMLVRTAGVLVLCDDLHALLSLVCGSTFSRTARAEERGQSAGQTSFNSPNCEFSLKGDRDGLSPPRQPDLPKRHDVYF